jgi:hypothetical protein
MQNRLTSLKRLLVRILILHRILRIAESNIPGDVDAAAISFEGKPT